MIVLYHRIDVAELFAFIFVSFVILLKFHPKCYNTYQLTDELFFMSNNSHVMDRREEWTYGVTKHLTFHVAVSLLYIAV